MAIFLRIINLVCIEAKLNPGRKVLLAISCCVFCPCTETYKASDGSISSLVLTLQDALVDSISNGFSEIRMQDCSQLWFKIIVIENEQPHCSLKVL